MRVTVSEIQDMKRRGEKIPMLTAYDYPTAQILDKTGIPMILVGDSLGQVVLGYDSTVQVTMEDMLHHIKAVVRGSNRALIVGDMPFMSYRVSLEASLKNASMFLQEGGAQAVKLEGGQTIVETVHQIVQSGIPVLGHIGLTPQSVYQLGGYKVQGKTLEEAAQLLRDARALEDAGAFGVVLELIPDSLAKVITDRLKIPTIGIGAGVHCDGQVQVINDILGLNRDFVPKHTRSYATLGDEIETSVRRYASDVQCVAFPEVKDAAYLDEVALDRLLSEI